MLAPIVKSLAPVRTGKLAAAVKVRALPRSRKWTGTQVTTKVGADGVFYGAFVDLGHKTRGGGKVEGKFFTKRAGDQARGSAGAAFIDGVKTAVEEAVR